MEFVLFLPQMRLSFDDLVARAQAAEVAGFTGIAGMDHLAPPLADDQPMYEAIVTSTWLAAHTERLRLGSLVLCDAFRHPAVLAREAVSIDHASGGRFELGLGWGSVVEEFTTFGAGSTRPAARVAAASGDPRGAQGALGGRGRRLRRRVPPPPTAPGRPRFRSVTSRS